MKIRNYALATGQNKVRLKFFKEITHGFHKNIKEQNCFQH